MIRNTHSKTSNLLEHIHSYKDPNDETPHRRVDLLQDNVDVFPGVKNRSMSKLVHREAEFLGGSVFTVKNETESVHYLTSSESERDAWIGHVMQSIRTKRGTPEKLRRRSSTVLVSAASGLWRDYKIDDRRSEKPKHVVALEIVRFSVVANVLRGREREREKQIIFNHHSIESGT